MNTPKLLPELLAFTKQGKPILFSISSRSIFWDFNRLNDEAIFMPFEERKFKQFILSNVSLDWYESHPVTGIFLYSKYDIKIYLYYFFY